MKIINRLLILGILLSSVALSCSDIKDTGKQTRPVIPGETDPDPETPDGDKDKLVIGKVGEVLEPWVKGSLDIHFINTGRGESTFYVLPDGTTMLVDMAGSLLTDEEAGGKYPTPPKPNASTSSATVIVNYINHFSSKSQSHGHIDYAILSHFHEDHMGTYRTTLPDGGDGTFKMTSFAEIGTILPYSHIMDRCYPDYDYPAPMTAAKYKNVQNFYAWTIANKGSVVEAFDAGKLNQISLVYDKGTYGSFKIQNLSANGEYWTGIAGNKERVIPDLAGFPPAYTAADRLHDENIYSCAFKMTFGAFDFYAGGDHQFQGRSTYPWKDSEAPITKIIGSVDVAKGSHHGTSNTNDKPLMQAMSPKVWVNHVWRDVQPNPTTISNVLYGNPNCDIFLTNLCAVNEPNFSAEQKVAMCSVSGHVCVRVNKTGTQYYMYVLDDNEMKYTVKSVHGPYVCK